MLGYQSLFIVDIEGFPLGHVEASLNVNQGNCWLAVSWIRCWVNPLRWSS